MDYGATPGRLLIIGGAEDRCCGAGLLDRFVELSGAEHARIVLVTTATDAPEQVHADYERVFRKLGVEDTSELRLSGRGDADSDEAAAVLTTATGVFLSGGDQSKLRTLVGSRVNDLLEDRLNEGLIVAGDERRRDRDGPHHDPRRGRTTSRPPPSARVRASACSRAR